MSEDDDGYEFDIDEHGVEFDEDDLILDTTEFDYSPSLEINIQADGDPLTPVCPECGDELEVKENEAEQENGSSLYFYPTVTEVTCGCDELRRFTIE